jgi:hypothetical protein
LPYLDWLGFGSIFYTIHMMYAQIFNSM